MDQIIDYQSALNPPSAYLSNIVFNMSTKLLTIEQIKNFYPNLLPSLFFTFTAQPYFQQFSYKRAQIIKHQQTLIEIKACGIVFRNHFHTRLKQYTFKAPKPLNHFLGSDLEGQHGYRRLRYLQKNAHNPQECIQSKLI